jgi:hypothetical protein
LGAGKKAYFFKSKATVPELELKKRIRTGNVKSHCTDHVHVIVT